MIFRAASIFIFFLTFWVAITAIAADRCDAIFSTQDRIEAAKEEALKKITSSKNTKGLSKGDLDLIVEKLFNKQEGSRHNFSDYFKSNSKERTIRTLQRQIAEEITQKGLIQFFQEHGYLIEKSKLTTRLISINRSASFNIASATWGVVGTLKGAPPVFLPEGSFKIKNEDLNLLLLKGVDSPEGQVIAQKYRIRMEFNRGYDVFSRYYYRFALAVFAYIAYDKIQDHLKNEKSSEQENEFDQLMDKINSHFGNEPSFQSKDDIVFHSVIKRFKEKYSREPNEEEMKLICQKVYGEKVCGR